MTSESVLAALKVVNDPDLGRDIVALNFVKGVAVDGGRVTFTVELSSPSSVTKALVHDQARAAVSALPGVGEVEVAMTFLVKSASAPEKGGPPLPGVKNVVAVGAGKGGVGKTTVAVNLAVALSKLGARDRTQALSVALQRGLVPR